MNTRTLPAGYTPPKPVDRRCLQTCRGLTIGGARPPEAPEVTADCGRIQAVLLERHPPAPRPLLQRIAIAAWRWC